MDKDAYNRTELINGQQAELEKFRRNMQQISKQVPVTETAKMNVEADQFFKIQNDLAHKGFETLAHILLDQIYNHVAKLDLDAFIDQIQTLNSNGNPALTALENRLREDIGLRDDYKPDHFFDFAYDCADIVLKADCDSKSRDAAIEALQQILPMTEYVENPIFDDYLSLTDIDELNDQNRHYIDQYRHISQEDNAGYGVTGITTALATYEATVVVLDDWIKRQEKRLSDRADPESLMTHYRDLSQRPNLSPGIFWVRAARNNDDMGRRCHAKWAIL